MAFLAILLLLFSSFTYNALGSLPQETIIGICSKTEYPDICINMFNNDLSTGLANNLADLSLVAIDNMYRLAVSGHLMFQTATYDHNQDEESRKVSEICMIYYHTIINLSAEAYTLSRKKLYNQITQFTQSARIAYLCEAKMPRKFKSNMLNILTRSMILRCKIAKAVVRAITG
ncbi:hypothetical protein ACFE04_009082 [Oxalis oulophora]